MFRNLAMSFPRHFLVGLVIFLLSAARSAAQSAAPQTILVLGDSLTAGYGLPDPATQAYPALLQQNLDATAPGAWRVINAGLSGDTTSGGLRRIDWALRQPVAILALALGSNDGLRGLDPALVAKNLAAIAAKVRTKNPSARVLLIGQRMPVSMGDYAARFDAVFPTLAAEHGWPLVPFLLEGVGGVAEFNQSDAIHPNEAGHARLAANVWTQLAPLVAAPSIAPASAPRPTTAATPATP